MKRLENSALPRSRPIGGISRSPTNDDTILPNAAPMITPIARSTTLPRNTKALNSFSIDTPPSQPSPYRSKRALRLELLVRLPPQECGHVEVLFRRLGALGANVRRHAPAPVPGGRRAGPGGALHLDH